MDDNTVCVELSSAYESAEGDHDPATDNLHTDPSVAETSRITAPDAGDDTAGSDDEEADGTEYEPAPATTNAASVAPEADNIPNFLRTGIPERLSFSAPLTGLPTVAPTTLSGPFDEYGQPFGGVEYFKVTNLQVNPPINLKNFSFQLKNPGALENSIKDAQRQFEKLSEFLRSMGCATFVKWGQENWQMVLYGGVYTTSIASRRSEYISFMERLLPPDEGWTFLPAFRGEMEKDIDGSLIEVWEGIIFYLQFFREASLYDVQDPDAEIRELRPTDLQDRLARWEQAGRSIDIYRRLGRRRDRLEGSERIEWLVKGLIPKRMVVLAGGAREIGKSTMMLELAVAVALRKLGATWLGQALNPSACQGLAVLLTGKDTDAVINSRLEHLDPEDRAAGIVVYALDGRPLSEIAEEIARMPNVSLIVVDPARRYIQGDEDGSGGVNDFFATLETIVQRTGATVVVVHHLTKNAKPANLQQVRESIRGSSVFLDRPRVVLGCFRRDNTTVIGGVKSNLPPGYQVVPAIHLRRDPETLRHTVETAAPGETRTSVGQDDLQRKVLDAIRQLNNGKERVTRAGDNEVWAKHTRELEGYGGIVSAPRWTR